MKLSKSNKGTVALLKSTVRLSAEDAKRFFDSIENLPTPNDKLLAAVRDYMKRLRERQG